MQPTWCLAVASAVSDPESSGLARQWREGDDRVVVVPLGDPMALTTWALAHGGLEHLIYVGRQAHAPGMAVAANLLTGRLPQLQVHTSTWCTTTLSLVSLSAQVSNSVETAHEAVAQLHQLVPAVWSGVWMRSVTGLDEPRPTIAQHLRSLMPGGPGYLATLTPYLRIERLPTAAGVSVLPGSTLIVGGQLREPELQQIKGQAAVSRSVVRAPVEDGKSQYGSSDAIELVWMQGAQVLPPSRPSGWCQVCRSPVWGQFCPFCQVAVVSYQGAE